MKKAANMVEENGTGTKYNWHQIQFTNGSGKSLKIRGWWWEQQREAGEVKWVTEDEAISREVGIATWNINKLFGKETELVEEMNNNNLQIKKNQKILWNICMVNKWTLTISVGVKSDEKMLKELKIIVKDDINK